VEVVWWRVEALISTNATEWILGESWNLDKREATDERSGFEASRGSGLVAC
jgi:hypothetical protein